MGSAEYIKKKLKENPKLVFCKQLSKDSTGTSIGVFYTSTIKQIKKESIKFPDDQFFVYLYPESGINDKKYEIKKGERI